MPYDIYKKWPETHILLACEKYTEQQMQHDAIDCLSRGFSTKLRVLVFNYFCIVLGLLCYPGLLLLTLFNFNYSMD